MAGGETDGGSAEQRPPGDRRRAAGAALLAWGRWLGQCAADTLMPPVCLACREPLASPDCLCVTCWSAVAFIRSPLCDRLGIPLPFDSGGVMVSAAAVSDPPPYDRARAVARYDGTVRALVHGLKFHDRQDVRTLLARWMAMAGTELIPGADLIVPVPLSRQRLLWRRFNQAALLAQELARIERRPFDPFALARVRSTASQVGLTRNERTANVRGAFAVPPAARERVEGRRVLLVDDIITTGATAGAAARALKRAGARAVDVIAVGMVTDEAAVPA